MLVWVSFSQLGIHKDSVKKVIKEFYVQTASMVIQELELLSATNALPMP